MRTTFPDEWSEAEYARQVARIEFRLYDHELGAASVEQPFIDEVMRKIANVPERWLPARRFNELIKSEDPCEEAAKKWKKVYREKQHGCVSFHQVSEIDPDPLLVAQLRLRLVHGAVPHYLSWQKFVSWVSATFRSNVDDAEQEEGRYELRRLENVYDALAISDLGSGVEVQKYVQEYMQRVLIIRSDNGLATYVSESMSEDVFKAKFGLSIYTRFAEGWTVDV